MKNSVFLDFLQNRIVCDPEYLKTNYDDFRSVYAYVAPLIGHIDRLEVKGNSVYGIHTNTNICSKETASMYFNGTVRVGDAHYTASVNTVSEKYIEIELASS